MSSVSLRHGCDAARIHVPGPQVDDASLAMEDGEGGADFATVIVALEVRREPLADGLEPGRDVAGHSASVRFICALIGLLI